MIVKKLLPPQAMRGILLGMRGLVRSYVTFAIVISAVLSCSMLGSSVWELMFAVGVRYRGHQCGLSVFTATPTLHCNKCSSITVKMSLKCAGVGP
jgi:hypothetical protein